VHLLLLAVIAMLIQQTMATVAKTVIPVLFPAIALDLGFASQAVLGYTWLFACVGMAVMAGCGTFIIRYGAIRISQVGGLLMAIGLGLAALAGLEGLDFQAGAALLILGAMLISTGSTSATPASSEILARCAPARIAPLIFSIKQTGVPAGIAVAGALVLPLSVWVGWQYAVLAVAGLCLLIALGLEYVVVNLIHLMAQPSHWGRRVARRDVGHRVSRATPPNGLAAPPQAGPPGPVAALRFLPDAPTSCREPRLPTGPGGPVKWVRLAATCSSALPGGI
jgi:MFS family permease